MSAPQPPNPTAASIPARNPPLPLIRSINSRTQSRVRFISRTRRKIAIYWVDYRGSRVRYTSLDYGEIFPIFTYVTHPWLFRDQDSGDVLTTSKGDEVYWPKEWKDGRGPDDVIIGIPVYTLREISMQRIRQMLPRETLREKISTLDLPNTVKHDLINGRDVAPYTVRVRVM